MKIYLVTSNRHRELKGEFSASTGYMLFTSLLKARRYIHNYCTSSNGNTSWIEHPTLQRRVVPKFVVKRLNESRDTFQNVALATYKGVKQFKDAKTELWFWIYVNKI